MDRMFGGAYLGNVESPMRIAVAVVFIAASGCSSSREEVLDGLVVDAPDFVDPVDPADGLVFVLDAGADPALVFTAWGVGHTEQHGTWSRYNVRVVQSITEVDRYDVAVEVQLNSVATAYSALDRHLQTDDFFDVDTYPTGTFTGVATAGEEPQQFLVAGDLTLRGTTRSISFPATIEADAAGLRSAATMEFSRWDFGLYPSDATGPGADGVDDRVLLDYDVRLAPAQ